jgi:hypothetical protein
MSRWSKFVRRLADACGTTWASIKESLIIGFSIAWEFSPSERCPCGLMDKYKLQATGQTLPRGCHSFGRHNPSCQTGPPHLSAVLVRRLADICGIT